MGPAMPAKKRACQALSICMNFGPASSSERQSRFDVSSGSNSRLNATFRMRCACSSEV